MSSSAIIISQGRAISGTRALSRAHSAVIPAMNFRLGLVLSILAAALSPATADAEEPCSGHQFLQTPRPEASCQMLVLEIFVSSDQATHAVVLPVDVSLYATPDMESRVVTSNGDTLTSEIIPHHAARTAIASTLRSGRSTRSSSSTASRLRVAISPGRFRSWCTAANATCSPSSAT